MPAGSSDACEMMDSFGVFYTESLSCNWICTIVNGQASVGKACPIEDVIQ